METPPLARRKRLVVVHIRSLDRNTSTYVEKTRDAPRRPSRFQKHLRLRGEKCNRQVNALHTDGNTSTSVKKYISKFRYISIYKRHLQEPCSRKTSSWKHLRLRGENSPKMRNTTGKKETPPLAQRKLIVLVICVTTGRNTSACAEKTGMRGSFDGRNRKHLRLRGENLHRGGNCPS